MPNKGARLTIYTIAMSVFALNYLSAVFANKKFYNMSELLIVALACISFFKVPTPIFIKAVFTAIGINSLMFIALSPFFHYYSLITNFRDWVIPMLLFSIGYRYSSSQDDKKLNKFLIFLIFISLPLSILGQSVYLDRFSLFDISAAGDPVGGIWGPRGSGMMGMFLSTIVIFLLVQNNILKEKISKGQLAYIICIFIGLTVWAEAKIVIFLTPFLLVSLSMFVSNKFLKYLRSGAVGVAVVVIFIVLYQTLYTDIEGGASFSSQFNSQSIQLEQARRGDYSPFEKKDSHREDEMSIRLSRIGAIYFAWDMIAKDTRTLVFGFGPGTAQHSAKYDSAVMQLGYTWYRLDFFQLAAILFEYGLIGVFLWVAVLVHLYLRVLRYLRRVQNTGERPSNIVLFLAIMIPTIFISLLYNWAFFRLNFGGIFFLFLGAAWNKLSTAQGILLNSKHGVTRN